MQSIYQYHSSLYTEDQFSDRRFRWGCGLPHSYELDLSVAPRWYPRPGTTDEPYYGLHHKDDNRWRGTKFNFQCGKGWVVSGVRAHYEHT